jgi:hypothetical protein
MDAARTMALMLDPSLILTAQGLAPDPWQRDLLLCTDNSVLLCCSRQAGKSTTVAALAVHTALYRAPALTGWISTLDGVYVYGPASDLRDRVTVKINGQTFSLSADPKSAPPPEIPGTFSDLEVDNSALRTFFDSWRGRDPGSAGGQRPPQTFTLKARSGKDVPPNGQRLALKEWDPSKNALQMTPAPEEPVSLSPDDSYALDLTFVDHELGSNVLISWPGVRFKPVYYQDPRTRSRIPFTRLDTEPRFGGDIKRIPQSLRQNCRGAAHQGIPRSFSAGFTREYP